MKRTRILSTRCGRTVLLAWLFFSGLLLCARCARAQTPAAECTLTSDGLYDEQGFTIPGLEGATVGKPARVTAKGVWTGLEVAELKPGSNYAMIPRAKCSARLPGLLEVGLVQVHIHRLLRVQMNGLTYAYVVFSAVGSPPDKDHPINEIASMQLYAFIDMDGDGKFTVMKQVDIRALFPDPPAWVK